MLTRGDQLGPYCIQKIISRRIMVEVCQAQDTGNQQEVAIKVISNGNNQTIPQKDLDDFCREAQMMAQLRHPRILPLLSVNLDVDKGVLYIVMPYCQEGDLNSWLENGVGQFGRLPLEGVAHFVHQAAEALQYVHNNNIVHRDVKPSNFLVQGQKENLNSPYPDICLADFGIARLTTTDITAIVIGTQKYMAPEQWENRPDDIGAHTDQYALGIMTYELLTGHCPFEGPLEKLGEQHCKVVPQPPSTRRSGISGNIDNVILCALEKDPRKRFSSVSEFDQAFQKAIVDNMRTKTGSGLDREDDPDLHKRVKLDQSGNSVESLEQSDPPQEIHYPKTVPAIQSPLPITAPYQPSLAGTLPGQVGGRGGSRDIGMPSWVIPTLSVLVVISVVMLSLWRIGLPPFSPTPVTPTPVPLSNKVIKLAVDLPLSDQDGKPVEHGVQLATDHVISVSGYTVEFEQSSALDDMHDPSTGANNITTLKGDAQVAGIIGPFNSDVATAEIPLAASNGPIALISPSNTSDCLTVEPCGGNQGLLADAKNTYFRTTALDSEQGDRLANYLYNNKHYRTASIFEEEPNVYGQGFAQNFCDAWQGLGGKVLPLNSCNKLINVSSPPEQNDYTDKLQPLVHNSPDVVFFGGDALGATLLHGLMKHYNSLAMTPFASGGAVMDEGYIKDFEGGGPVYAIAPVGDPSQEPNGQDFMGRYDENATFGGDRTLYSASAYDCTNILIQAIGSVLAAGVKPPINKDDQQDARKFRQKVIDELHSSSFSYQGVTGVYSFNGNSDVTKPSVSIYQLENGQWQFQEMETYPW